MPVVTATPARIRRSVRPAEFARTTNATILANNPTALDGYEDVQETFFDMTTDAQIFLDEKAAQLMAHRKHLAIETATPFGFVSVIPISPVLPNARAIDRESEFDRTMMLKGMAIDLQDGRNAIELVG